MEKSNRAAGHSYRALLVALILLLVAYPALRGPAGAPILARLFVTVVFLAGFWVIFATRRLRLFAIALGAPTLLGVWTSYALPDRHAAAAAATLHLLAVLFYLFVLCVLLRAVYRERAVSVDVVAAALCGYLLVGFAFAHLYCLLDLVVPGSFNGLNRAESETDTNLLLTYFSFVTLTTVGYGDITPARDTARSLSLVEAVTGQFYLAVLVADLVGKHVAQVLSSAPNSTD
jgi:hypothetical protein